MQTAVNRVLRIGRATMLAIGIGVSLALVLGAATVALAAVPGDPFRLGQLNVINATTTLRGGPPTSDGLLRLQRTDGIGAVLKVENIKTAGISRGIDINVPAGNAPISVNPDAGKATGLNADRLDGLSAGSFLTDSADRNDFMPNDTYVNQASKAGPGSSGTVFASADCDPGDKLLGGGGQAVDPNEDTVTASVPFVAGQGWDFQIRDNDEASSVDAFALCADFPPEH